MARRVVCAVLMALFAAGFAASADAANMVANPGFETGSLAPWFVDRNHASSGPTWTVTSVNPRSGSFDATVGDVYELRQNFSSPIPVSSITSLTFWWLTTNMAFDFFYSDSSQNVENSVFGPGSTWQIEDATSLLAPGQNLVAISFWGRGGGNSSLDDVTLDATVSTNPIPEPSSLLLLGTCLVGLRRRRR